MTITERNLDAPGMRELIKLTNTQFSFWEQALRSETSEEFSTGNLMNYWLIMSTLALYTPDYKMDKKKSFSILPGLGTETVRKYVSAVEALGFVQTVRYKGTGYLQLTPAGQRAVASTLARWAAGFTKLHREYFSY